MSIHIGSFPYGSYYYYYLLTHQPTQKLKQMDYGKLVQQLMGLFIMKGGVCSIGTLLER